MALLPLSLATPDVGTGVEFLSSLFFSIGAASD
jgi:hypothetical protein